MKRILSLLLALMIVTALPAGLASDAQGAAAPTPEPVDKAHSEYVLGQVLRGVGWDMTMEQTAQLENVELKKKATSVVVKKIELFDMSVPTMTYHFEDGVMVSREFMFSMKEDYTLIFYAMYYFYGAPNYNTKKTYTWEQKDMQIVLVKAKNPTVTFTVRRPAATVAPEADS